jgi:hypothetical protein
MRKIKTRTFITNNNQYYTIIKANDSKAQKAKHVRASYNASYDRAQFYNASNDRANYNASNDNERRATNSADK